jgi:hypothetical protein
MIGTTKGDVMSMTTGEKQRATFADAEIAELIDCGPLLLAYARSGVVETAAHSLRMPANAVESGLRSGRSLRELAHERDRDAGDLQLALARGAQSTRIDDQTAGELIASAGRLLDVPLLLGTR